MRRHVVALAVLALLSGCDSPAPTRPDGSPTPTGPEPESPPTVTAVTVAGDGRFTALNQVHAFTATAQMSNGSARDVTAEAAWSSSNPAVANVSAHGEVTSAGVGLATITAEYSTANSLDVTVSPLDRSQIPGLYRLSFTAASACSALPDWARHREYDATIDQPREANAAGALLVLSVQLPWAVVLRFEGLLKGSHVSFWFPTDEPYSYGDGDPIFADRIDDARLFTVTGNARGTKTASRIVQFTGTLEGPIGAVNPITDTMIASCGGGSFKNQFSLVRQ